MPGVPTLDSAIERVRAGSLSEGARSSSWRCTPPTARPRPSRSPTSSWPPCSRARRLPAGPRRPGQRDALGERAHPLSSTGPASPAPLAHYGQGRARGRDRRRRVAAAHFARAGRPRAATTTPTCSRGAPAPRSPPYASARPRGRRAGPRAPRRSPAARLAVRHRAGGCAPWPPSTPHADRTSPAAQALAEPRRRPGRAARRPDRDRPRRPAAAHRTRRRRRGGALALLRGAEEYAGRESSGRSRAGSAACSTGSASSRARCRARRSPR